MLGFLRKKHVDPVPGTDLTKQSDIGRTWPRPEAEIDFIISLLEKNFGVPFRKRIKLDGYIDEPVYRLVIDNYDSAVSDKFLNIRGGSCKNVLDVNAKFIEKYWKDFEKYSNADIKSMSSLDRDLYNDWKLSVVTDSREKLILMMEVAGVA